MSSRTKNWALDSFNRWSTGFIVLLLTVSGCASPSPTVKAPAVVPVKVLTVSGSGSTTPVLEAIKPAFEADTPGYRLEVFAGTGTNGAMKGLLEGTLDLVAMARLPKPEETTQNVKFILLGQGSQAVLAHPNVGVSNLTSAQVAAIFSGEITTWKQVGGPDNEIVLYVRDEGDSTTETLRKNIIHDTPFPERTARVLTSQNAMQMAVAGTPWSIGIGTLPAVVAVGAKVKPVALDGVAPSEPSYRMTSPLGIGYLAKRQSDVQPLINWLSSERGRAKLKALEIFVPSS